MNGTRFPIPSGDLSAVESRLREIITKIDLGAPVIGVDIKGIRVTIPSNPLNLTIVDPFPPPPNDYLPQQLPVRPLTLPPLSNTTTVIVNVVESKTVNAPSEVFDSKTMAIVVSSLVGIAVIIGGASYALYRCKRSKVHATTEGD